MATQKALVVLEKGVLKVFDPYPILPVRPGTVRVRVRAVALNPIDNSHLHTWPCAGCIAGYDFAGEVEAVFQGQPVPGTSPRSFSIGDRVCGVVHGTNVLAPSVGAFAEYLVEKTEFLIRMPSHLSFAEASSLGMACITAGFALYYYLGLPLPPAKVAQDREYILIYGASTATGTLAVQLAKLSGFKVVATCSPRNFELVKSRGADWVFDYHSENAVAEIKELTGHELGLVLNCVRGDEAMGFCSSCIGEEGGKLCKLASGKDTDRKDVEKSMVLGYSARGEASYEFGFHSPAMPELADFANKFLEVTEKLLAERKLQPHALDVRDGGLDAVAPGLKELASGTVSGKKIVCELPLGS